jgi:hypothetical protein
MLALALSFSAGGATPSTYDTDAQAYFDAIVTNGGSDPGGTRKGLINDLVLGLKSDSIWSKITALYLLAAHDNVAARVNIKTPATVATANGGLTFTADQGYAGNATDAYVDTSLTATTITRTDATMFALCNSVSTTSLSPIMGYETTGEIRLDSNTLASNRARLGSATGSAPTTLPGNDNFIAVRRSGTAQTINVDTSVEGSVTVTDSATGATNPIYLLRVSSTYGNSQISIAGWGVWLTDTETNNLRTRLRTYLTGIGML